MIVCYTRLSEKTILKEAEQTKKKIAKWFKDNPKRRVCKAELWYGKITIIKPNSVDADIDKAAAIAITG